MTDDASRRRRPGHRSGELAITRYRRFPDWGSDLLAIQAHWEQALRKAVQELPAIHFGDLPASE
jgi:hypothetical protein